MSKRTQESIDKEASLIPAATILETGIASYFNDMDTDYLVSIEVPKTGASPVNLTGKAERHSVAFKSASLEGELPELTNDMDILASVRDALSSYIEVVVAADVLLIADLEGALYVDPTCEITREQIALDMSEGLGVNVYWDPRLLFPLITLADPLFHFAGTYYDLLETLIAPYKMGSINLAYILIEPDEVRVVYMESGTQDITELEIGSDIYLEELRIDRNRPKQIRKVGASWYTPQDLQEETITLVEERKDKGGYVIGKTIHILKTLGNVLLEEQELNYMQLIVNWIITGGPIVPKEAEQDPIIYLQYKKTVIYEYEPEPTPSNVHYIRNFKLVNRQENITYYLPSSLDDGIVWYTNEILSSYSYNSDGDLLAETQRTAKNRNSYSELGYVNGEITVIKYFPISQDIYQMSKDVSSFRAYETSEGEDWPADGDLNPLSHVTQTVMGSLPSSPSIPTPKNMDYVLSDERVEDVASFGSDEFTELKFDPGDTFNLFFERATSISFNVVITGKCTYDLRPGLWIKLIIGKDVTVRTISPDGDIETSKFSDLIATLPILFVKSVAVEKREKEQVTIIEGLGWTPSVIT